MRYLGRMKNHVITGVFIFVAALFMFVANVMEVQAYIQTEGTVVSDSAVIRKEPNANSNAIASIMKGDKVTINNEEADSNGVIWQIGRELYVDRDAPILRMSQDYEGIAVKGNKITVSGSTVDAAQVLINGEAATLGADGLFSKELTLQPGENTVTVSALDSLGNEARYTATVYSGEVTEQTDDDQQGFMEKLLGGGYWVLLISGVFALLVVGYGLIFWRKEKKDETV